MKQPKKEQEIRIKTISGELRIKRPYCYCKKCRYGETPYDRMIGIEELPYKITKELMTEIAFYGKVNHRCTEVQGMCLGLKALYRLKPVETTH